MGREARGGGDGIDSRAAAKERGEDGENVMGNQATNKLEPQHAA